ncbi:MAG: hypothetical protein O2971_06315 [Proteobacteria bacterium]|nr:hypothetical protein [Pseudomonadota bacterium]
MAVDDSGGINDNGRVYIAWSTRNRTGEEENPEWIDSRIVISSSENGETWTEPHPIDYDFSFSSRGHQIQPSLTFSHGKLLMIYLDFRQDRSEIFERYIADVPTDPPTYRHTVDVRAAMALPEAQPTFVADYSILNQGTTQLSRYFNLMLQYDANTQPQREQLQFNPLNQPLFKGGTVPFIGDYIDVAASPAFIPNSDGSWSYNTSSDDSPVFHAAWSDNRDVRGPPDGDWTKYVPPQNDYSSGGTSIFDPNQTVQACVAGVNDEYTGMRNQNIYTSRITQGLFVGIPANAKPLREDLPRSFVLFAKYSSNTVSLNNPDDPNESTFVLRIVNQPDGTVGPDWTKATFNQSAFSLLNREAPVFDKTVTINKNSSTAQTIFVTSMNPRARVEVEVYELNGTLRGTALINPDASNPDPVFDLEEYAATVKDTEKYFEANLFDTRLFESLEDGTLVLGNDLDLVDGNPDGFDLLTQSLAQLSLTNPDLFNPGIYNPGIYNPGIYNPGIYNPGIYNPGIYNPGIYNPGIYNPGIYNPGIYNPGIYNPGIYNSTITDVTYTIENDGATSSAYDVNIRLDEIPVDADGNPLYSYQLIVSRFSTTPVPDACEIIETSVQEVLVNNTNPELLKKLLDPNSNDSFYLDPGDTAVVTLRIIPNVVDENNPPPPPAVSDISIAVLEDAVDEEDFVQGDTQPDIQVVLSDDIAPLVISTAALAHAIGGQAGYSQQLTATGGAGTRVWTVVPGTFLPRGLQLSPSGELHGTPLEGGTFTIAVRVTDDTAFVKRLYSISITAPADLVITALTHSPDSPTDSDVVTYTATVNNVGQEPAIASMLRFEITGGSTPDATSDATSDAFPFASLPVPSLAGGASALIQYQSVPWLYADDIQVLATADSTEVVIESDETNNSNSDSFSVTPTYVISSVTPTTMAAGIGQTLTIKGFGFPEPFDSPNLVIYIKQGEITVQAIGRIGTHVNPLPNGESVSLWWLPDFRGLVPGPAILEVGNHVDGRRSDPVDIIISSVPSTPVIATILDTIADPAGGEFNCYVNFGGVSSQVSAGQTIAIPSVGIDIYASDAEVIFEQGQGEALVRTVVATSCTTLLNTADDIKLTPVVEIPSGLFSAGPLRVSVRTTVNGLVSADSAPVILDYVVSLPELVTGEWTPVGDMNEARNGATASLLPDGRVLVQGGIQNSCCWNRTDIYDPQSRTFSAGPVIPNPHGVGSTATTLPDGRILIIGGNLSRSAEIFDPDTDTWRATGGLTLGPRERHSATLLEDGRVLVAGGSTVIEGQRWSTDTAEIWDPLTGLFTATSMDLNEDRTSHSAVRLPSGDVVLLGGTYTTTPGFASFRYNIELYDPVADTFTLSSATLTQSGQWGAYDTVLLDSGKVLFVGRPGAELYDPVADTVTPTGALDGPSCFDCSVTKLADGRVLIAGGLIPQVESPTNTVTTVVEAQIYDPPSDTFTAVASLNQARYNLVTTLLQNGQVLTVGGYEVESATSLAAAEVYWPNPVKTIWLGNIGGYERLSVSCPVGETAVGMAARYDDGSDSESEEPGLYERRTYTAALRCATLDSNWDYSTVTDTSFLDYWGSEHDNSLLEYTCESGEIMIGVLGTVGFDNTGYRNPNTFEGLLCQNQAGAIRVEEASVIKGPARTTFTPATLQSVECAPGTVVTALEGWTAAWMDRFRFSCGDLNAIEIEPLPPLVVTTAALGGSGGSPFSISCPANHDAVGLVGRAGDDIDRTQLVCREVFSTDPASLYSTDVFSAAVGGGGGSDYGSALSCPPSVSVLTGIRASIHPSEGWIDTLGSRCTYFGGATIDQGLEGLSEGGATQSLNCPTGFAVTGLNLRQGALLDNIQAVCTEFNFGSLGGS